MELKKAEVLGELVKVHLGPLVERSLIVGSVRRRKPTVHDIDIVVVPKGGKDLLWNAIPRRLELIGFKRLKGGPQLQVYGLDASEEVMVDIYRASQETWGILTLVRTGSKEHNVFLCQRAFDLGLKFSAARGVLRDGQVIAAATEQEIFKALQMAYVPPEKREIASKMEKEVSICQLTK